MIEKVDLIDATFSRFLTVWDCSGSIERYTLNNNELEIDLTMLIIQKNSAVGRNNEFPSGHFQGGIHIIIEQVNHIGKAYNKNGRRFPNFPGFLLSTITPNMIERKAPIINWDVTPIETRIELRLMVYT